MPRPSPATTPGLAEPPRTTSATHGTTENLHGIAVAGVERVQFDPARQQLTATLRDALGDTATLVEKATRRVKSKGAPIVGDHAFTHTAKLRVKAMCKDDSSYWIDPALIGRATELVVADQETRQRVRRPAHATCIR